MIALFKQKNFNNNNKKMAANLVNTRQRRVAERIMSCCDRADWDFCMARWRSFCGQR